ncbi:uncharacterized protein LOC131932458 [Physella acuta]|uniref:uncharacterized protein LOC131932458 n=1 Tax=Physella acuta TaxID=109671 RepID=UPI0027DC0A89|nr:uncharacterized protein LOC131932458 [Physella acuta]
MCIFRVDQEARSDSCDTCNDQLDFYYAEEDAKCSEHNYCKRLYTSLLEEFNNLDTTAGQHSTSCNDQISIKEEYFIETVNAENVSKLKHIESCCADLEIKEEPTSDTDCQTTDLPEVKIEVVNDEMWEESLNQRPSDLENGGLYLTEVTEALSEELRNFNVLNLMLSAGFL